MPKFEVAIMNPPYGKLYVDFFNKAVDCCERVISVQPSNHIVNKQPTRRNKNVMDMINTIDTRYTELELIDGNAHFSAGFYTPLGIFYVDTTKKNENGVKVTGYYEAELMSKDINMLGPWTLRFYDLFRGMDSINNHTNHEGNFYVALAELRGTPPKLVAE